MTIFTGHTLLFYFRRIFLVIAVIYFPEYMIWQFMSQIYISVAAIIFIGYYYPYESRFANHMHMFTEVCTIFVLYLVTTFTEFTSIKARNSCGLAFIAIISIYLLVNIFFLMRDPCLKLKRTCKDKCIKKQFSQKKEEK